MGQSSAAFRGRWRTVDGGVDLLDDPAEQLVVDCLDERVADSVCVGGKELRDHALAGCVKATCREGAIQASGTHLKGQGVRLNIKV